MAILQRRTDQVIDANGDPLVNASIYIGEHGQDPEANPITIYSDSDFSTSLTNPQNTDSQGRFENDIYTNQNYSYIIKDSDDVVFEGPKNRQIQDIVQYNNADYLSTFFTVELAANSYEISSTFNAVPASGVYLLTFPTTNTGASTLKFNGLSTNYPIEFNETALEAGAIKTTGAVTAYWDGSTFELSEVVTTEDWHDVDATGEPAFENSWVNFESNNPVASFKKLDGVVFIKGTVKDGSAADDDMFTLPESYRPDEKRAIVSVSQSGICTITVDTDGTVKAGSGGSTTWTHINISYAL